MVDREDGVRVSDTHRKFSDVRLEQCSAIAITAASVMFSQPLLSDGSGRGSDIRGLIRDKRWTRRMG